MSSLRGSRTSSRAAAATAFAVLLMALTVLLALSPPAGAGGGLPTFTLSVTKSGSGEGTVVSQPAGIICGSVCAVDFPSGQPVTLVAKSSHGSRFKGWDGTVKGSAKRLAVPAPLNGLPTDVEATFDKAEPPTASFHGQYNPKEINLRLGCGEPGPCKLRVTVFASWLSKKGWDPHRATHIVGSANDGKRYWNVAVGLGKVGKRMARFLKMHPRRKGTIKVVVKDTETGLRLAIKTKGVGPRKKKSTN